MSLTAWHLEKHVKHLQRRLDAIPSAYNGIATVATGLLENETGAYNAAILQGIINGAESGDWIQIPEGRFLMGVVTINKNVNIQGVRGGTTIVNATTGDYTGVPIFVQGIPNETPQTLLTASLKPGETTVPVASVSGLTAGQWVLIRDSRSMMAWNSQDTKNEDVVQIESVGASSVVLRQPLTRRYLTTRAAALHAFTSAPPEVYVGGINFERCRVVYRYAVNGMISDCKVEQCDHPSFALESSYGCMIVDCRTEAPHSRVLQTLGQCFYMYNASHCSVVRHTARWCEGAVLRRGTRYAIIKDCTFEGATSGLALNTGDCKFNLVEGCTFDGAVLQWGNGGHYSDSYNVARNCTIRNAPTNSIGTGGGATAELILTYDGRATKTTSEHGFEHGDAVCMYGTTIPTGLTKLRRYYAICPTYGTGTWGQEFLPSLYPERSMVTVTFDNTNKYVAMGDGWATGDAVVLTGSVPTKLQSNRIHFLRNVSANNFYLQIRAAQTASFDSGADTVTLADAAGSEWVDGDAIMFVGGVLPAEISAAPTVYYLRDKTGSDTFKLAATAGGVAIDLSAGSSGTTYAVCGFTTAGSGTITAYGGTPVSLSGSASAAAITTIAERNVFRNIDIANSGYNVVYMHRCASTLYDSISLNGAADLTNGSSMFSLANSTDIEIVNCRDKNGLVTSNNRVASFSSCFGVTIRNSIFNKSCTGNYITGGTSEDIRVIDSEFPQMSLSTDLFGPSIVTNSRVSFSPTKVETTTYAASLDIKLGLECIKKITLTGDLTLTGSSYVPGSTVTLLLDPGAATRNLAFPGGWKFFPAAPASIDANKLGKLVLESTTTAEAGVYATWTVQT